MLHKHAFILLRQLVFFSLFLSFCRCECKALDRRRGVKGASSNIEGVFERGYTDIGPSDVNWQHIISSRVEKVAYSSLSYLSSLMMTNVSQGENMRWG